MQTNLKYFESYFEKVFPGPTDSIAVGPRGAAARSNVPGGRGCEGGGAGRASRAALNAGRDAAAPARILPDDDELALRVFVDPPGRGGILDGRARGDDVADPPPIRCRWYAAGESLLELELG